MRSLLLSFLIIASAAARLCALDPALAITQYVQNHWSTDDGLPQASVQAIAQTPDGYLWLGTQEGLVRFDGVRFTVFDKSTVDAMRANHVSSLTVDREGALWIGMKPGLIRMRLGVFTVIDLGADASVDEVASICADATGIVWAGTSAHGLIRIDKGSVARLRNEEGKSDDSIMSLCIDKDGRVWAGVSSGLVRVQGEKLIRVKVPGLGETMSVLAVTADRSGRVWFARKDGHVGCLENGEVAWQAKVAATDIWVLFVDSAGALWIGSSGSGLLRRTNGVLSSMRRAEGLADDFIQALFEDREGNLWAGTGSAGATRLAQPKFTLYTTVEGLSADQASTVYETADGSLCIGTDGAGLSFLKNNRITTFGKKDGLSSDHVLTAFRDGEGTLWVGTEGGGLDRFGTDGSHRRYGIRDGLPSDGVWAICEDPKGGLWLGTYGFGLVHMDPSGRFRVFSRKDGLTDDIVIALCPSATGCLWVGTDRGGLNRLENGRFTAYTTGGGLTSDSITSILEDELGDLWVGTYGGGLNLISGRKLSSFTTKQGLFDDVVFQILDDLSGNLWMSCNKGIFRVSKADLHAMARGEISRISCVSYGKADGLKSVECNGGTQPAGCRDHLGRLWFPTQRGVAMIDPAHESVNAQPPPVVIESVIVDGRAVPASGDAVLPPGRRSIQFRYSALTFVAPERTRFKYRLEGFETDWTDAGTRREAYFTNLPPGRYRFQVLACNRDGVWNKDGASFRMVLTPFYYQRLWFIVACAMGAVLSGVGIHRLRLRQLWRREAELVRMVGERTRELAGVNAMLAQRTRQLETANERLKELSYQDELTGVPNRRHFDEVLDDEWKRARRTKAPLSLLMIDADSFKAYNDHLGHQAGDGCIRRIAGAMSAELRRTSDLLARYGGEEFAVILPTTDAAGARVLAESLRESVESLGMPHPKSLAGPVITISIGVATVYPLDDSTTPDSLISAADQALYRAKAGGRNRVVAAAGDECPAS